MLDEFYFGHESYELLMGGLHNFRFKDAELNRNPGNDEFDIVDAKTKDRVHCRAIRQEPCGLQDGAVTRVFFDVVAESNASASAEEELDVDVSEKFKLLNLFGKFIY